jgi:urease gamma subunit
VIKSISEKLSNEMKINLNEALYIYLDYIMRSLDLDRKVNEIIPFASTLLTPDQVMIGVPESLRKITFSILKPNSQRLDIIIREPIQTPAYILSP